VPALPASSDCVFDQKHTNLTALDFSLNAIGDSGTKAIAVSLPSSLAHLRLSHNRIADSGARALAAALAQSQVTALDLRQNSIGDAGACELLPLLVDSSLRQISLAGNQLGDEAAAVVAELLALGVSNISHIADDAPNANRIDLSDNRIGAVGVGCIAEALTSSSVESLSLAGNPLGDAGLLELAQHLSAMSNLRSLDIGRTVDGQQSVGLLSVFNVLAGDQLDAEGKVIAPESQVCLLPTCVCNS
jgi:GTP pyrophosphokinase